MHRNDFLSAVFHCVYHEGDERIVEKVGSTCREMLNDRGYSQVDVKMGADERDEEEAIMVGEKAGERGEVDRVEVYF